MKAKISFLSKLVSVFLLAGLLVSAFTLAFPSGSVAAESLAQEPTELERTPDPARLEKVYQRELELLERQAEHLDNLDERAVKFAERISELKQKGKDVTSLEKALAVFKETIADARGEHAKAAEILKTHAGFDANGKVTDVTQAQATVKEAGKIMRSIHQDLRPAIRQIVKVMRQFIRDNR